MFQHVYCSTIKTVGMLAISVERKEQLERLDNFIANTRKELSSIVSALGWSIESLSKDVENVVVCPFNESHHIPERSLEKHLEDCQWKAEGYAKDDAPLSIRSLPPGSASSIKFDEQLQDAVIQNAKHRNPTMAIGARGRLIPRTSDRLVADFTRDERCAMYEYVIENTIPPDIGEDIADMNKPKSASDGRKSSYLELLAQERNLKRRRAKYRGVHTNKKSQVEILREVISQQMEMLGEYITEKNDDPSHWATNDLPIDETPHDGRVDTRRYDDSRRVDGFAPQKCVPTTSDGNGRRRDSRGQKSSEDCSFHRGSSNDRGYDRGNGDSRDSEKRSNGSRGKKTYRGEHSRESSRARRSRKSSHKSHRDRSKDGHGERHKRHRSRDRGKSRSSRDSRHDDGRSESSRDSKYDDRKRKKRSRD